MGIKWGLIKRDYECSKLPIKAIALKRGCSAVALRERAKKQGWSRKGIPAKARVDKTEKAANGHECILRESDFDNSMLWGGVKRRLIKGLAKTDAKEGLEELKVAKIAGEVLSSVIKGEMISKGQAGGAEQPGYDTEDITREMAEATVSRGTDETLD